MPVLVVVGKTKDSRKFLVRSVWIADVIVRHAPRCVQMVSSLPVFVFTRKLLL